MPETPPTSLLLWNDIGAGQPAPPVGGGEQIGIALAAARACRASNKTEEFAVQFDNLLQSLHRWLEGFGEKTKSANIAIREHDLLFLVVQKNARFDAELSDALSDLDLLVANSPQFALIDLEVMAIPPVSAQSLQAMLSSGTVIYDAK